MVPKRLLVIQNRVRRILQANASVNFIRSQLTRFFKFLKMTRILRIPYDLHIRTAACLLAETFGNPRKPSEPPRKPLPYASGNPSETPGLRSRFSKNHISLALQVRSQRRLDYLIDWPVGQIMQLDDAPAGPQGEGGRELAASSGRSGPA